MRQPALIYRKEPLFGFDIGTRTAKFMQLGTHGKKTPVLAYGSAEFPEDAIVEGIIVDPQEIADALIPLLNKSTFGRITAHRIAASIPVARVFTRVLNLPPMNPTDLGAAVKLEAEQYIPVPLPDLYIDYEIIEQLPEHIEVLMVAAPRAIIDSYLKLFEILKLDVALLESSLSAVTRAILAVSSLDQTTLVADFGSASIDLTVHDRVIRLTDTISMGGDDLTRQLATTLEITHDQAHDIKVKFGLSKSGLQPKVKAALTAQLDTISAEMRRVMKFYQDRGHDQRPVKTVMLAGGSAGMPGLVEYLTAQLGIPVTIADPWAGLEFKTVPHVSKHEAPMFTTAIGLAQLEGRL